MPQKYTPDNTVIPQSRREEINTKILYVINAGSSALPDSAIYNCYTGIGGLHGLELKDFRNYHDFAEAKKEAEMGQFFTPPLVCAAAVGVLAVEPSERVLDACCGIGGFFNFLPAEENAWGFDIDPNALKVAGRLYPNAHLRRLDVRCWMPEREDKYDVIFQNAPYNLPFKDGQDKDITSQMYTLLKSADALNTAGLIAVICPSSFLADTFWNRTDIEKVSERFSFIGQSQLPADAFKAVGVESFRTKLMIWSLRCESIEGIPYDGSFCTLDELKERVSIFREKKHAARLKLIRESALTDGDTVFAYELRKLLFQIKAHPATRGSYGKATDYYQQFLTQKAPEGVTQAEYKQWYDHKRITKEKVLAYCRRLLAAQHPKKVRPGIRLINDRSGIRFVSDNAQGKKTLKDCNVTQLTVTGIATNGMSMERYFPGSLLATVDRKTLKAAQKTIRKRHDTFLENQTPVSQTEVRNDIRTYLDSFCFHNNSGTPCRFTDLQKEDLGHLLGRPFSLINWQQGSGKTAALYAFGRYLLDTGRTRTVFIVAPALAVNLTWKPFLEANGERYSILRSRSDIETAGKKGSFLVVPLSMMGTLYKPLRQLCRTMSWKATLLFDESDELSNPLSVRTRATLAAFRRLKHKMLATGTATRNNIAELYSQLELLYNNSTNMLCDCAFIYSFDKDGNLEEKSNDYYMRPFPARAGHQLFRACFCPGKTSVFGIKKFNQDVYNAESLNAICERTIVTRQFKEFAGQKYRIETVSVTPTDAEKAVYDKIFNDLQNLIPLYFSPQSDTRKESALRIIRTITLLIKACSVPHLMPGYNSGALPTKTGEIIRLVRSLREKVIIGTTTLEAVKMYSDILSREFPARKLFTVNGSVDFKRRDSLLKTFEATDDGILVCTQQSLKSSVNIPSCNQVIIESLQWNIPKIQQFFFRTIRFDSKEDTTVRFITYDQTIEQNILGLLMTKQRLNEFIKTGEVQSEDDVLEEYGLASDFLDTLLEKQHDKDGRVFFTWGGQRLQP